MVSKEWNLADIRYGRVWEDHRILSKALLITREDVILCLTSAGDNVLNLLLDKPKKIIALDLSPAQNAILELKLACLRSDSFTYEGYMCLIGWHEKSDRGSRLDLYHSIKHLLPSYAQEYWDAHSSVLEGGICHLGHLECYASKFHSIHLPTVVSNEDTDRLLASKTTEEQKSVFDQLPLEKLKEVFTWYASKQQLKEEGKRTDSMVQHDFPEDEIGVRFWKRFCRMCREVPVWDNFYLAWWLRGGRGFEPDNTDSKAATAPPCLTRSGFSQLKSLVDRVDIITGSLQDYLTQKDLPAFSKAVLSDALDYMDPDTAELTFKALADNMVTGGRAVFWNLMAHRVPSSENKLKVLAELSDELHKEDRVFFYSSFYVAEVTL